MRRGAGRSHARWSAGFTLLEVLVAFAILTVAVVAVIQGFAGGLRLLKVAGDHQHAVLLADQKVREVVIPVEGHDKGQDGAFDWERTVTVVPAPDLERTPATRKWHVYQIDVKVRWGGTRGIEIVTLRTAAEQPNPGTPLAGTPVMGAPAVGSPPRGTPAVGTPAMRSPAMGTTR